MIKDVLGDDTSIVDTSLVCSEIATEKNLFTRFVDGRHRLICPAKEVSDRLCERTLLVLYNLIVLLAFHLALNSTDPHV